MIFDSIDHLKNYVGINAGLDQVIQLISNQQLDHSKAGKVIVEGDSLFYLVQEYTTQELSDVKIEAHRQYIDLQLIIKGDEIMECANIKELTMLTTYDENSDIQFFQGDVNRLSARENDFAVFFPHDGHRTGLALQTTKQVKKIVFKIACDHY